jgi:metal-responsive CopG/Arc/MetJ family transcriptional regulator
MPRPVLGARKIPVNATIDPRLLADVDARAKALEVPRSEVIREALRLWLETQQQEAEVDRRLATLAQERLADSADDWVSHEAVKARTGL